MAVIYGAGDADALTCDGSADLLWDLRGQGFSVRRWKRPAHRGSGTDTLDSGPGADFLQGGCEDVLYSRDLRSKLSVRCLGARDRSDGLRGGAPLPSPRLPRAAHRCLGGPGAPCPWTARGNRSVPPSGADAAQTRNLDAIPTGWLVLISCILRKPRFRIFARAERGKSSV